MATGDGDDDVLCGIMMMAPMCCVVWCVNAVKDDAEGNGPGSGSAATIDAAAPVRLVDGAAFIPCALRVDRPSFVSFWPTNLYPFL